MKNLLFTVVLAALLAAPGLAQEQEEEDVLAAYLWVARPVIVFADSDQDPRFTRQMDDFATNVELMDERDVVILTDTDPDTLGPLRERFRPSGFNIVLVGKDGQIKLRRPHPISAESLSRQIDRMPNRRREMRGGQS